MPQHIHGEACVAEILGMWDSTFLPIQDAIRQQTRNPLLQYSLPLYFSELVVPRIECPSLRAWFRVYLASPAIDASLPLRRNMTGLVFLAQSLSDWFDQGWLTTQWRSVGQPRLLGIARQLRMLRDTPPFP